VLGPPFGLRSVRFDRLWWGPMHGSPIQSFGRVWVHGKESRRYQSRNESRWKLNGVWLSSVRSSHAQLDAKVPCCGLHRRKELV
jgi:hypothetical protein